MRKFIAISLLTLMLSACGNSGSGGSSSAAAKPMPPECVSFYKALSACNLEGNPSTPDEAAAQFAEFEKAWQAEGDGAATVEQCKSLDETLRAAPGC